jgi:cobalt-zinc-cadmium efflux system outer membrane protein
MLSTLLVAVSLAAAPAPAPPQAVAAGSPATITVEQAVSTVLARSPSRQSAQAKRDAAQRAAEAAGAWPNPSIEIRSENWTFGSWAWTPLPDPGSPPGLDFFTVLTQPVELGGQRGKRIGIAQAEQAAAEAAMAQVDRALVMETVRYFMDAVRSREWLQALDSNREGLDTLLRAMTSRVREGYAAEADLAKFQAESARVQTQLLRARLDLARSLAQLGSLMQEPIPLRAEQLAQPVLRPIPAGNPAELAARAAAASPEVLAAKARSARAAQALSLERARRVPDLNVAGGYKRTAGFDTAVAGLMIAIPLFDRNTQAVALASGDHAAALSDVAAAEARARADAQVVFDAAATLVERAARVDDELLKPAELVRTAARSAFREGATDILLLVDAERVYVDARREAVQLKLDAIAAALEARLLLGEEIVR